MMIEYESKSEKIVESLKTKSSHKLNTYNNVLSVFNKFKSELIDTEAFLRKSIPKKYSHIPITYTDTGDFEAELKLGGDVLVFSMHTNIFCFDRDHEVWKTSYVKEDKFRAYCGIIYIYNFLTDSIKYRRENDIGYLVGRIFINNENHYFVEGKKQIGLLYNNFMNAIVDDKAIKSIVESAVLYCLDFDLLAPPFDTVKEVTVDEMMQNVNSMNLKTGKRLGFKFLADLTKEQEKNKPIK